MSPALPVPQAGCKAASPLHAARLVLAVLPDGAALLLPSCHDSHWSRGSQPFAGSLPRVRAASWSCVLPSGGVLLATASGRSLDVVNLHVPPPQAGGVPSSPSASAQLPETSQGQVCALLPVCRVVDETAHGSVRAWIVGLSSGEVLALYCTVSDEGSLALDLQALHGQGAAAGTLEHLCVLPVGPSAPSLDAPWRVSCAQDMLRDTCIVSAKRQSLSWWWRHTAEEQPAPNVPGELSGSGWALSCQPARVGVHVEVQGVVAGVDGVITCLAPVPAPCMHVASSHAGGGVLVGTSHRRVQLWRGEPLLRAVLDAKSVTPVDEWGRSVIPWQAATKGQAQAAAPLPCGRSMVVVVATPPSTPEAKGPSLSLSALLPASDLHSAGWMSACCQLPLGAALRPLTPSVAPLAQALPAALSLVCHRALQDACGVGEATAGAGQRDVLVDTLHTPDAGKAWPLTTAVGCLDVHTGMLPLLLEVDGELAPPGGRPSARALVVLVHVIPLLQAAVDCFTQASMAVARQAARLPPGFSVLEATAHVAAVLQVHARLHLLRLRRARLLAYTCLHCLVLQAAPSAPGAARHVSWLGAAARAASEQAPDMAELPALLRDSAELPVEFTLAALEGSQVQEAGSGGEGSGAAGVAPSDATWQVESLATAWPCMHTSSATGEGGEEASHRCPLSLLPTSQGAAVTLLGQPALVHASVVGKLGFLADPGGGDSEDTPPFGSALRTLAAET